MKYYLKEEFLHDNNVKNAGNKARNDVEEIVKREGKTDYFQFANADRYID